MGGDLLKKITAFDKEKINFSEFVDNILTNKLNTAEIKCFTLFKTFLFLNQNFILC